MELESVQNADLADAHTDMHRAACHVPPPLQLNGQLSLREPDNRLPLEAIVGAQVLASPLSVQRQAFLWGPTHESPAQKGHHGQLIMPPVGRNQMVQLVFGNRWQCAVRATTRLSQPATCGQGGLRPPRRCDAQK